MKALSKILSKSTIHLEVLAKGRNEVLSFLADSLIQQGFVKSSYLEAVLNRERIFPTGLQTVEGGVAIPHTDPVHVNLEAVSIGILKNPVTFQMMGYNDQSVKVDIVFMLAMKDANSQIDMLQELTNIIQDKNCLKSMKKAQSPEELMRIILNK